MEEQLGKYVRNLKAWSLPHIEDLEDQLVDELAAKARAMYFDRGLFAEEFYSVFVDPPAATQIPPPVAVSNSST